MSQGTCTLVHHLLLPLLLFLSLPVPDPLWVTNDDDLLLGLRILGLDYAHFLPDFNLGQFGHCRSVLVAVQQRRSLNVPARCKEKVVTGEVLYVCAKVHINKLYPRKVVDLFP